MSSFEEGDDERLKFSLSLSVSMFEWDAPLLGN